jgi:hypothetical protein
LKTLSKWWVLVFLLITAGCDSGHGPDSLFSQQPGLRGPVSECTRCHNSTISPTMDPLISNGTGTYGKHVKHVQERRIACERCHYNYLNAPTHMNGSFDTGNPAVNLVTMDIVGPAGLWTNDTGTGTGSCAGVACHANTTLDWYGTNTWTLPVCTSCHTSDYSAALDPIIINGTPPAGRHVKHVTSRSIDCERCHNNYPSATTHANGVLDTGDPDVSLVRFNIVGPAALWINDTGAQTGDCSSVACHGTDTLSWYGTGTWTLPAVCTTCHTSSYSSVLDPIATNGSGLAGKHVNHVTNYNMDCSKCHLDYPTKTSHANGTLDTPNPSVLLVYFDATNPTGTWINDTGQETGNCSSLFCHGADEPAWYGLGGVTFPSCAVCHGSPIGSRRQIFGASGDFGQNINSQSHHVSGGNDPTSTQCQVCHDLSQHMGGTVWLKTADSGSAVVYDPASPSSAEPFCLSCHDTDGAASTFATGGTPTSPFNDGSVLGQIPYRASTDIRDNWNKAYGHRQQGLTCLGTGSPGTGCHANGHGAPAIGILAKNLQIPQPDRYRETDFAICFECHQSYPAVTKEVVFGVKFTEVVSGVTITHNYDWDHGPAQDPLLRSDPAFVMYPPYNLPGGIQTHFRDQNYNGTTGKPYDDFVAYGQYLNLHWFHIAAQVWSYRGTIAQTGVSCTACHSVHGSNTQQGMVYDQLQYTVYSSGSDSYGTLLSDLNNIVQYPTYCLSTFNCHASFSGFFGPMHNWYEPANE